MKIFLIVLVVVAIIPAAIIVGLKMKNGGPEGIAVETAPVGRMTIVQTVEATGRIQPRTQVNISADVSAKITRLDVKEGEWVEQGQLLLELDSERYTAAVERSEASLRSSQSNVNLALENVNKSAKDFERMKNLFDENLEPQASLDASYATAQVEKARHQSALDQVEQTRATLKQSRDDLAKTIIFAPMSGTISLLNKEVGEIALGSQFQEDVIMIISNLSGMEALVDVDENDIISVSIGDTSTIEVDALPGQELQGEVTEIANSAKLSANGSADQKTEFEVKIAITDKNSDLRPGMTASGDIVTDTQTETLGVPIQCVAIRTPEQISEGSATDLASEPGDTNDFTPDKDGFVEIIFVIRDGHAWATQVQTGIQGTTNIQILEGLSEDDIIVTGNYRAISKDLQHGSMIIDSTAETTGDDAEDVERN
jgi:HlyD family secretion protein